ncbi:MAG: acyltransferase [Erysipelotrichaceae bacterium]|nr:acyltransferase [Erysipelotrichaceae bacterium]
MIEKLNNKNRNSNIEALRIISILLIICHHYVIHGFSKVENISMMNQYLLGILSLGGKLGVTCFILISGYYMIHTRFTVKKCLRIVFEVWTYSFILGMIYFMMTKSISVKDAISVIFPIGTSLYWFMTDYLILMAASPLLNIVIEHLDQSFYRKSIILMIVFWSIFPILGLKYAFNDLLWFICLYFIAGYIRLFHNNTDNTNILRYFFVAFSSYFIVMLSNFLFILLGHTFHSNMLLQRSMHFSSLNSPFILMTAVSLFHAFSTMSTRSSKWINLFSSCTLGVYLIHDNMLMRTYIWDNILKCSLFADSVFLIFHCLFSVVMIYLVCCFIDLVRQQTLERLFLKRLNKQNKKIFPQ